MGEKSARPRAQDTKAVACVARRRWHGAADTDMRRDETRQASRPTISSFCEIAERGSSNQHLGDIILACGGVGGGVLCKLIGGGLGGWGWGIWCLVGWMGGVAWMLIGRGG